MKTRKLRLSTETLYRLDLGRATGGASIACSVPCTALCTVKGPGCTGTGGGGGTPTAQFTCDPCSGQCETGGACTAGVISNCGC